MDIPAILVAELRAAERVAVLTGAGISRESGIPTFREALTGLWENYDPQELATAVAFRRNPKMVWEWYAMRRAQIATVQPNPGHVALAEMERHVADFTLITQNVDGLHRKAGSRCVLELHGNIQRVKCLDRGHPVETYDESGAVPPRCPRCGSLLRPDVVWFGENLPMGAIMTALDAARNCELFFSIGTSSVVEPAASLPYEALQHGATIVEVNPEETPLSEHAAYVLRGPAGGVLPALLQAAWPTGA